MKKLLKKSLSCILALTLIVSALPMFAIASDGEAEPTKFNAIDSVSVRGKGEAQGSTLYVYNTSGSNHRVAFLKFDLTGITYEQIRTIGSASLSIFARNAAGAYTGLKASILPADCENWDNTLVYNDATSMLSSSIPVVSQDAETIGSNTEEYKTITGLGDAIAQHLITDDDDKIVCIRLEAVSSANPTLFRNHTDTYCPYLSLTFDGAYRLPEPTLTVATSTRSNDAVQGSNLYVMNQGGSNIRYSFLKFDFSNFSQADLYRIKDVSLNMYYKATASQTYGYSGFNVSVLPATCEVFDDTLIHSVASSMGMLDNLSTVDSFNIDNLTEKTAAWKEAPRLGSAVISHLFSDTDDKIVCFRLSSYNNNISDFSPITDASYKPYLTVTAVETDEEYIQAVANSISFASISSQPVYAVTNDLNLSAVALPDDVTLTWASSDTSIISSTGVVTHKLNAKPVTLTATISLKSDPSISVTKSFRVTTLANDGAEIRHYWDFDNDIGLNDHYDTAEFMSENTYDATVGNDLVDSGNKVAVLNQQTTSADNYLTLTGQINSTNARYIAISTDIYDVSNGNAYVGYRYQVGTTGGRTAIISTKNSLNKWESYLTVIDMTTPENSARYVMENNAWTKYDNVAEPSYRAFGTTGIDRITVSGIKSGATMYFDNFSVKAYEDFYAEVNAATEANVIAVIESFDNMGIIELPVSYASADKAALATAIKAKVAYASDDEVILAIEKALSDGSIIIGEETVSENVLTQVKFATKASVANTNIKFVAASYTASNELVAVSVADVESVSADWNTASLYLSLANSAKIKYMLWSDIDTTIVPIVKVSEK